MRRYFLYRLSGAYVFGGLRACSANALDLAGAHSTL